MHLNVLIHVAQCALNNQSLKSYIFADLIYPFSHPDPSRPENIPLLATTSKKPGSLPSDASLPAHPPSFSVPSATTGEISRASRSNLIHAESFFLEQGLPASRLVSISSQQRGERYSPLLQKSSFRTLQLGEAKVTQCRCMVSVGAGVVIATAMEKSLFVGRDRPFTEL